MTKVIGSHSPLSTAAPPQIKLSPLRTVSLRKQIDMACYVRGKNNL